MGVDEQDDAKAEANVKADDRDARQPLGFFAALKAAGYALMNRIEDEEVVDEVDSFDCMICGRCLWRDKKPQTSFACIVYTRRRELAKLASTPPNVVSVHEYPQICSRECFDVVKSTWAWHEPSMNEASFVVDGEIVGVMWDTRPFVLPARTS